MRRTRAILGVLLLSLVVGAGLAQQPPALPAINPAAARLDATLGGLEAPGVCVVLCEDSGLLVVACEDGSLHYWHKDAILGVRGGEHPPNSLADRSSPITALVHVPGGVATAGTDGKIRLRTLPDEKMVRTLEAGGVVRSLAATSDGKRLASVGEDGTVHLWDVAAGKEATKLAGAADWQNAVAFSPDGKSVAAGGFDGKWRLWDVATGKKTFEVEALAPPPPNTPARPANPIHALAFSPDGKTLAVGGADGQIYLFQTTDGKFVRALAGHGSAVTGLAFHPSGQVLASSSKDRTVRLWNPANPQPLKNLDGHTNWVQGVVFLAQGTRLASVGADGTVRLWELTEPKK
jgi:WD40 repeat protein